MVMPVTNAGAAAPTPPAAATPPVDPAAKPPEAAAAPPAGEKPAEATPAAPPEETKEQKAARLSRAARAARAGAARNRELEAQNRQLSQHLHTTVQRGQTAEQQLTQIRELAKRDPYAATKALGLDLARLTQQAVREGTPEAEFQRQLEEARTEAREAKEKITAWEQREQAAKSEQARAATVEQFQKAAGDAASYPNVARMPAEARFAWAMQIVAADRAHAQRVLPPEQFARYEPTDRQILAHMEKLAASSGAPPKALTESNPDEKPAGSATPTTVTTAQTSKVYTLPGNFDQLSDREQKHHLARYLESIGGGKKKK